MRASHLHSPFARNPAMLANPLAGIPLVRPVAQVLGWTEQQKAAWCVVRDANNLAGAEQAYASACANLGHANRRKSMRRVWVANAFRAINVQRAALRRAHKALAASQIALAALAVAKA